MALKLPPLKLSQLKNLAFQCGISSSGTKSALTSRLIDEIKPHRDGATKVKRTILSIDMGIRNLAYCVLEQDTRSLATPSIIAWKRMTVSSRPIQDPESLEPTPKETFEPAALAAITYKLLRHHLLLLNPTHVLIERQRFRSMGSRNILEWTLRVNMFENMLYAALHTLAEEGVWKGVVKAINPGKVGPYWFGTSTEGQLEKKRSAASLKAQYKRAKIDLVQSWLLSGEMVAPKTAEAEATTKAYIEKCHRSGDRRTKKAKSEIVEEEKAGKLDDLADSLLQGLAWIEWEQKKRSILKHGVDVDSLK